MATVAELLAVLRADTRQFSTAMAKSKGEVAGLSSATKDYSKAGVAGFALVGAVVAKSVADFTKFQTTMVRTQTLAGNTQAQMESLSRSVLDTAASLGADPQEMADALYQTESAGIDAAHAMDVVTYAAKASAIGLGSQAEIVDATTSVLNAYGQENISAAQATDILVTAVKDGKGEADAIAGAIGRVIPIASQMGVTFDQVAGGIAALTQTGLDANEAVTSLRGILTGLLNPSKQASDVLDSVGLSAESVQKSIDQNGLLATLQDMRDRFDGNVSSMGAVFGNVRALAGVMSLLGSNGDDVAKVFADVAKSSGSTDEAMKLVAETAEFKLAQAVSTVKVEMIKLGGAAAPVVTSFVQLLAKAAPLIPAILGLVAALSALAVMNKVKGWIASVSGVLESFGAKATAAGGATKGLGAASTFASKNLGALTLAAGGAILLFQVLDGLWRSAHINLDQMSKETKISSKALEYFRDLGDGWGHAFEAHSFDGFIAGIGDTTDNLKELTDAAVPLQQRMADIGIGVEAQTAILTKNADLYDGSSESIFKWGERTSGTIDIIQAWAKQIGKGGLTLDDFTKMTAGYGLTADDAYRVASAAMDHHGKTVQRTGKIVKNFAGLTSDELDKLKTDYMETFNYVGGVLSKYAGKTKITAQSVIRSFQKQYQAIQDYSANLAAVQRRNIPDDILKQLTDMGMEGAGLMQLLADASKKDFDRIVAQMRRGETAASKLTDQILGIPTHVDTTVTTHFKHTGTPDGRTSVHQYHSGGRIMHAGGAVKRMHAGGLRRDEVPIIAQRGEYMVQKTAVDALGVRTMDAINSIGHGPRSVGSGGALDQPRGGSSSRSRSSIMVRLDRRHYDEETLYQEDYGRGF